MYKVYEIYTMKTTKRNKHKRRLAKGPIGSGSPHADWAYNFLPFEERLSAEVLGQRDAVQKVASILSCHINRERIKTSTPASRVLIVGGPSVGKSFLIEKALELLQVPKTFANCAMISPPGYRGFDCSSALKNLIAEARDISRAERSSVCVLDEIDKLKRRGSDDFLKQIEYSMLPILNGEPVVVDTEESETPVTFSTRNTLVFAMGVFPEVSPSNWQSAEKSQRALLRYGFSEEFVSRFSHFIYMPPINRISLQSLVEREIQSAASTYKTGKFIPIISRLEMANLNKAVLKNNLGIRGIRTNIHELLFTKARAASVEAYF